MLERQIDMRNKTEIKRQQEKPIELVRLRYIYMYRFLHGDTYVVGMLVAYHVGQSGLMLGRVVPTNLPAPLL